MTLHGEQFTPSAMNVIQRAMQFAGEMRHHAVGSEHLLYSLADPQSEPTGNILTASGLDADLIRAMIEQYDGFGTASEQPQGITAETGRLLEQATRIANQMGSEQAAPEHILAALMRDSRCVAYRIVARSGADPERIIRELTDCMKEDKPGMPKNAKDNTKTLDQFSRDLTAMAKEGKLDPVIGRDKEIQRVVQILSRRSKNNPVLIGEPGVGKTAIAEGLAQRVVAGNVPDTLQNKRVVSLDLARMVSGAKYRGDFEERIKNTLDEIMAAGDVVLFIDELHTLIGAGAGEGSMDAANIIKPPLSRGELQVIGATTLNEYRQNIEKDAALERRFQTVLVDEPSPEDTVEILKGLRPRYEEHHKLHISDEAIEAAVKLSVRYISDRYLPDKAIDLIDEAASRVRTSGDSTPTDLKALESRLAALNTEKEDAVKYQDYERAAMLRDMQKQVREELEAARTNWMKDSSGGVGQQDVAQVVAAWTGVPVTMLTEDESARLLKMEEILHQRVIGQDEAVRAVSRAIRRGRVGLKDPKRPTGSFLFLGPTGVGKTELCKALAEAMFGDESAMLRVDMSEYMERHTVSKLIGSPPGYVGYDEGGQLTEKVRRKPYSVILFDEIEKAHPDVFNIMLQIMEDGILTDSQGRRVDFRNTVIVMTSNVGAKNITDRRSALGFGGKDADGEQTVSVEKIREAVMGDLRNTFRPEFLNRIDDIIVFHQLDQQNIQAIARLMLAQVAERMQQLGITFAADDSAVELIAKKGFDPVYGARPLRREIQSSIEDAAAEKMLEAAVGEGGSITVTADGEELVLTVTAAKEVVAVA